MSIQIRSLRFDHFNFNVFDLQRSLDFYSDPQARNYAAKKHPMALLFSIPW